jgi:hypothetical protein
MAMNTAFDKILVKLAPAWAERRATARHNIRVLDGWSQHSGGYAGGSQTRDRRNQAGYRSRGQDEENLTRNTLTNMRLESMDLYRNNPLCESGVDGIVKYLGHSVPTARTAAKASDKIQAAQWDKAATDWFTGYFWNRADASRRPGVTFGQHQDYVEMASWLTGDMAFVIESDGLVPIEGERIETPAKLSADTSIVRGVRRDGKGRWSHIYVCDRGRGGEVDRASFQRVPMANVIFCPWYWRPDQVRGVPGLHAVVTALKDHGEIHGATKMKIKSEASTNTIEKARQEEMAKRDALATAIRDVFPAAHRLALELECLLLDTKDTAVMSKWWDSAHEALEQWREFLREDASKAAAPMAPTTAA